MRDTQTNTPKSPVRAAQYVRMSTEHQRYSTQNQADAIAQYAKEHGMQIVRTYEDEGKSGLNLEGRAGLLSLLSEVQEGQADFSVVLVYDISRWGRFQDADESGYWEYVCKRAGVAIHYCAEQFNNDGSLPSVILKNLKRTMAGEYSRELSTKVFAGQCRLIELGYRQGGVAGYGLRRLLIDEAHQSKAILSRGERKSLQTDRVVLVPGPEDEQKVVREIYESFIERRKTEQQIADGLNIRGVASDAGRPWSRGTIHQILINPKYVGANVFNRRSFKLKHRRISNPPAMWVRNDEAFPPIIDLDTFNRAAEIIASRSIHLSNDEMLERLSTLYKTRGKLSGFIIDESECMPSSSVFRNRFGSLRRAYIAIGYSPERDYSFIEINRQLREKHSKCVEEIVTELTSIGAHVEFEQETGSLSINSCFKARVVLARCRISRNGHLRWQIHLENSNFFDLTIAARMEQDNKSILDFYLLPRGSELNAKLSLAAENPLVLDVYRFDDLRLLYALSRRVWVGEAA